MGAVLVLLLGAAALSSFVGPARARTIYVGGSPEYSVAFKTEGGRHYALELAGTANCYFSEPREAIGPEPFGVFRHPAPMEKSGPHYVASATFSGFFSAEAWLGVNFAPDLVTGGFTYTSDEDGFRCKAGSEGLRARRYEPAGDGPISPVEGESPAYYEKSRSIETFVRVDPKVVTVRGGFHSRCPIGRAEAIAAENSLFGLPVSIRRGDDGSFRRRILATGSTTSGKPFQEVVTLLGSVTEADVRGTYRRVRTTTPRHGRHERCATGPLSFDAARYLPATSAPTN